MELGLQKHLSETRPEEQEDLHTAESMLVT